MVGYSLQLDDAEVARYRSMAARALEHEETLWHAAGIRSGGDVVDLGCGPGAYLEALAERTAPDGRVTGVDASEDAVAAARTLVQRLDLADRAQIVHARCEATGLPETSFDTIFMRNVLIHNGPNVDSILAHARALLKPGGHLLAMEIDATATEMPPTASDEYEMEMRWVDWASSVGNDPAFGRVLAKTVERAGFTIRDTQSRVDQLSVERSPVWTARGALLEGGFATELDIDRWGRAIAGRLSTVGLLDARLHVYVVVGQRP